MASAATGLCSCILLPLPMPTTRVPPSAPSLSFPVHCHRADSEPIGARSAQKNMLCAVIPAAFPSCAPKGTHHVVPPTKPNLLCHACSWPFAGFPGPSDAPRQICPLFPHIPSAFPTSFPSLCPDSPNFKALAQTGTFLSCARTLELNPSPDFPFIFFFLTQNKDFFFSG